MDRMNASGGKPARNRRLSGKLVFFTFAMFGFGFLLIPMYRVACEAFGVNVLALSEQDGARGAAVPFNTQVDASRTVTVEFDANARGPWAFRPEVASVSVHPGEVTTVMFDFRNRQERTMSAQAIASYAPAQAAAHFAKLECFCFTQWTLGPGESKRWPVVFVIDRKLPRDVTTITLSYTFFEVGAPVPPAPTAQAVPVEGANRVRGT
jgi:cytochrome c oxidase assembly protein subunit 11